MAKRSTLITILLASLLVIGVVRDCNAGGLTEGFYHRTCPQAEKLVKEITWKLTSSNRALGAKLIRLHFHDCFVRGCDGSVLLDPVGGTQAEKDAFPNQSLSGFDVIDQIKKALEKACPGTVSCADILALAARDAVSYPFQKDLWDVLTGRRDGTVSLASDANGNLPSSFDGLPSLEQLFIKKGLNLTDLVVLSGAHTIGVAHCGAFSKRLYNFTGKGDTDPSLNRSYAQTLKAECPNPANPTTIVEMDPSSSLSFDTHYYSIVLKKKGLFVSDAALLDPTTVGLVKKLQFPSVFFYKFARSMEKMGAIGVLTGTNGQIRKNCRVVN